jgi:hypothetical protein
MAGDAEADLIAASKELLRVRYAASLITGAGSLAQTFVTPFRTEPAPATKKNATLY